MRLGPGASGAVARPGVGGDEALCRRFEGCAKRFSARPYVATACARTCWTLRRRMSRELAQTDPARFDIKQDPGGIADIEFPRPVLGFWRLLPSIPSSSLIRTTSGNWRAGACGDGSIGDGAWLEETYVNYRTILHTCRWKADSGWWSRTACGDACQVREMLARSLRNRR